MWLPWRHHGNGSTSLYITKPRPLNPTYFMSLILTWLHCHGVSMVTAAASLSCIGICICFSTRTSPASNYWLLSPWLTWRRPGTRWGSRDGSSTWWQGQSSPGPVAPWGPEHHHPCPLPLAAIAFGTQKECSHTTTTKNFNTHTQLKNVHQHKTMLC